MSEFIDSVPGMPPVEVTSGNRGDVVIPNDQVTPDMMQRANITHVDAEGNFAQRTPEATGEHADVAKHAGEVAMTGGQPPLVEGPQL